MHLFPFLRLLFASILINIGPGYEARAKGMIIENGNFTINGTSITPNWKYSSFISALGPIDHSNLDAPAIDTYDSLGLMLWRERMDTAVTQIKILFQKDDEYIYNWHTKGFYKGNLTIEGLSISSQTTLAELKKGLPQYNIIKKYGGDYGTYKKIHLFAFFNESETQLLSLCIRNRCD